MVAAVPDRMKLEAPRLLSDTEACHDLGILPRAKRSGLARNPYCGDLVRLDLSVDESGRVREARHDGRGCLVSRTAASLLCREIEGKTLTELRAMPAEAMLELLEMPLTPLRRVCALLPWTCLQSILRKADSTDAGCLCSTAAEVPT